MNIVEVSPEAVPFAKTGGLADVVGSLPLALEKQGAQVRLVLPAYSVIPYDRLSVQDTGIRFSVPVSNRQEPAEVLQARVGKAGSLFHQSRPLLSAGVSLLDSRRGLCG